MSFCLSLCLSAKPLWAVLGVLGVSARPSAKFSGRKSTSFCESIALHNPGRNIISVGPLNEQTNFSLIYRNCEIILITSTIVPKFTGDHTGKYSDDSNGNTEGSTSFSLFHLFWIILHSPIQMNNMRELGALLFRTRKLWMRSNLYAISD